MQLHNIPKNSSNRDAKRIGRGGDRGKTSGRGMKGQNARTGTSKRAELRDTIKKYPKLRGHGIHGNRSKAIMFSYAAVNLAALEQAFDNGAVVNPQTLLEAGLIKKVRGTIERAKILGNGEITKKLTIENLAISDSAQAKIEKAGGSVSV